MTHTPEQLKELAEFAAGFLGFKKKMLDRSNCGYGSPYWVLSGMWSLREEDIESRFFEGEREIIINHFPSMLMHLAQEVLEREGFISFRYFTINKSYWISDVDNDYFANGKNKFIAFWQAVRQAKGGK
jgi:hypothetical protein